MDSSTTTFWISLFPTAGCLVSFYTVLYIPVVDTNSVDPDQMPHSVTILKNSHQHEILYFDL